MAEPESGCLVNEAYYRNLERFQLPPEMLINALRIGQARSDYAHGHGVRNVGQGDNDARDHIVGHMWEKGLGLITNLDVPDAVGVVGGVDVGGLLEAKGRKFVGNEEFQQLNIRKNVRDHMPVVLGWVWADTWHMQARGWLFGNEGKEFGRRFGQWREAQKAWFVPCKFLRPMETLFQWLERRTLPTLTSTRRLPSLGGIGTFRGTNGMRL